MTKINHNLQRVFFELLFETKGTEKAGSINMTKTAAVFDVDWNENLITFMIFEL